MKNDSQFLLVHFIKEEQVNELEKIFSYSETTVFQWPMARKEALKETLVIDHAPWLKLMRENIQK